MSYIKWGESRSGVLFDGDWYRADGAPDPPVLSAFAEGADGRVQAAMFAVTEPEIYFPSQSLYGFPGISLCMTWRAGSAPAVLAYSADSGSFGRYSPEFSSARVISAAPGDEIFWTPDDATKNGDKVTVSLIDADGQILARTTLTADVTGDGADLQYSLKQP
jgi:hypothetical protein